MSPQIAEIWVSIGARLENFQKGMSDAEKAMQNVGKKFESMGAEMQKAGVGMVSLGAPIMAMGGIALKVFGDFDSAMTQSTAIMGELSDAMRKDMVAAAQEVARTTTFSAKEAAQAFFFLASAGLDAAASVAALPTVAKFAQAGMFDLALATDLLTDAQSALGLTVRDDAVKNMENMVRVADVLVKANTLANASVQQFSEALTTRAGAALRMVNKDVEEGVAVLATFADQGVKGAEAGTRLDIVLRDLQTRAIKNADTFKEFGVTVFDSSGKMRNTADIIADLERAMSGMSDEQKRATLMQMEFQDRSVASILTLIGFSDNIRNYEKGLRNAGGTMDEVSRKQLATMNAQFKLAKNNIELAAIAIGGKLAPMALSIAKKIQDVTKSLAAWIEKHPMLTKWIALTGVALGGLLVMGGTFLIVMGSLIRAIGSIISIMPTLRATLAMTTRTLGTLRTALTLSTGGLLAIAAAAVYAHKIISDLTKAKEDATDADYRAFEANMKLRQKLAEVGDAVGLTRKEFVALTQKYGENYAAMAMAIKKGKEGKELQEALAKAGKKHAAAIEEQRDKTEDLSKAIEALGVETKEKAIAGLKELEKNLILVANSGKVAKEDLQPLAEQAKELADKYKIKLSPAVLALAEALRKTTEDTIGVVYATDKLFLSLEDIDAVIKELPPDMSKFGQTGKDVFDKLIPGFDTVKTSITNVDNEFGLLPSSFFDSGKEILTTNEKLEAGLLKTGDEVGVNWKNVNEQIEAQWINMISSLITNFTSFKDTVKNLFDSVFKMFADTVAKMVVEWIKGNASFKEVLGGFKEAVKQFGVFFAAWVSVNLVENLLQAFGVIADNFELLVDRMEADLTVITKDSLTAGDAVKKIGDETKKAFDVIDYMAEFDEALEKIVNTMESLSEEERLSTVEQSALNDVWEEAIKLVKEYGLEGNKTFIELMQRMRELGLESEALTDYIVGQLDRIPDALSGLIAPAAKAVEKVNEIKDTLAKQNKELAELEDASRKYQSLIEAIKTTETKIKSLEDSIVEQNEALALLEPGTDEYNKLAGGIAEAQLETEGFKTILAEQNRQLEELEIASDIYKDLTAAIAETQKQLESATTEIMGNSAAVERAGILALATFNAMIASGVSWTDAVTQMKDPLIALRDQYDALGLDANTALEELFGIIDVTEAHGELFEAIDANKTILEALGNSGWLTQDALNALATDAGEFYQNLIDAGISGDDALRMMGPTLQGLQDYADAYNLTLDEGTQALIDQAIEIGAVSEAQEDSVEIQKRLFGELGDRIKDIMDDVGDRIVGALSGGFDRAFGHAESAANSTAATIGGTLSAIQPVVDIGFDYAIPDFSNLRGRANIDFDYDLPDFSDLTGGAGGGGRGFQFGGIAWTPQLATVAEREPEIIMPLKEYRQERQGGGRGGGIVINFAPQISAMDSQDVRKFFQTKGREEIISLLKTNLRGFGREFKTEVEKF